MERTPDRQRQREPLRRLAAAKKAPLAREGAAVRAFGHAVRQAQLGIKDSTAKPLSGFGSVGVLEVVESADGDTYRAVYTVRFADAVYVLHCFQKKSTQGIATPKPDMDIIRSRLKAAEDHAKGARK